MTDLDIYVNLWPNYWVTAALKFFSLKYYVEVLIFQELKQNQNNNPRYNLLGIVSRFRHSFIDFRDFFRSSCPEVICKRGVFWNFAKFTGKHLWQNLFFIKAAGLSLQLYQKRDPGTDVFHRVFFCEYCGIFKNSRFYRTPLVAASRIIIHFLKN